MRVIDIITEKRSNSDLNPKPAAGHAAAVEYLQSLPDISNIGVSMTDLPKLGFNPKSIYTLTPSGVYFYPADYYINTINDSKILPFQHGANYIQIFQYNTNNVLRIDTVNDSIAMSLLNRLSKNLNINKEKIISIYNNAIADDEQPINQHLRSKSSGKFWETLRLISHKEDSNYSATWNKNIRIGLGYDVIIDYSGIIHIDEPAQGVVLNPRVIKLIKTFSKVREPVNIIADKMAYKAIETGQQLSHKDEKLIIKYSSSWLFKYAEKFYSGKIWDAATSYFLSNMDLAADYEINVLGGPWPAARQKFPELEILGFREPAKGKRELH